MIQLSVICLLLRNQLPLSTWGIFLNFNMYFLFWKQDGQKFVSSIFQCFFLNRIPPPLPSDIVVGTQLPKLVGVQGRKFFATTSSSATGTRTPRWQETLLLLRVRSCQGICTISKNIQNAFNLGSAKSFWNFS